MAADGEHVGTVDHCEGLNVIKSTKNDPAAGGEHHYIPIAWVGHGPPAAAHNAFRRG